MTDFNVHSIKGEKFVHIVSCNTHAIVSLLQALTDSTISNLQEADFVIVRRSEDIGSHERLINGHVVSRHLTEKGTHHANDALALYRLIGETPLITSSDITTPSQLFHSVHFRVSMKKPLLEVQTKFENFPFIAKTSKFDSNVIYDLGRRYGLSGRIYSHAIVVLNNLLFNENTVKGWAFIPQEGCTILSTLHAYLLQTNHQNAPQIMHFITSNLIKKEW